MTSLGKNVASATTDLDLAISHLIHGCGLPFSLVEDLMSRAPLFVSPDDNIVDLARQMAGARPKVYPVMEGGKVTGIISRRQVMQALNTQMKQCQAT